MEKRIYFLVVNKIYRINNQDNWKTAQIKPARDRFTQPSTAILDNGKVWPLHSKLNMLANPTLVPSQQFSIQIADFKPVN